MIGPIKTVGIYVEDTNAALDFYLDKLGFELRRREPLGNTGHEWIEVAPKGAETCLVVYSRSLMKDWRERKTSVVFHCADVEEFCNELAARGVKIAMKPSKMEFGTFAAFEDPDGNQFGITSQPIARGT